MIVVTDSGEKQIVYRLGETLDDIEEQIFAVVLENNSGSKAATARALGRTRGWVVNKIRQFGLEEKFPIEVPYRGRVAVPTDVGN